MKTSNDSVYIYYFIYKTTNLINSKIYVGKHKQIETFDFDGYLGSGIKIVRAVKKYGKENFYREPIEFCTSATYNDKEIYWITELSATNPLIGYNIAKGGEGGDLRSGKRNSEEANIKTGKGNTGKIRTEEQRRHYSEAKKGKPKSEEHKRNMGKTKIGNKNFLGHNHTKETKQKISESMKGKHYKNKFDYTLSNNENYWTFFNRKDKVNMYNKFKYYKVDIIIYHNIQVERKLKERTSD